MTNHELDDLIAACRHSGRRYLEFIHLTTMRAGVFILPVGARDDHQPHDRDELYNVVSGKGTLRVKSDDIEVSGGSLMFVTAGTEHHFHTITAELAILVFFGGESQQSQ
jgi:mannose-6-phosphate isomerase-like protein (cupin superfamily)